VNKYDMARHKTLAELCVINDEVISDLNRQLAEALEQDVMTNTQRELLIYAFRYALPRSSGAVDTVSMEIRKHWGDLPSFDKELVKREIRIAFETGRVGDDKDKIQWRKILELEL